MTNKIIHEERSFLPGYQVSHAVELLKEDRQKGKLTYIDFNGTNLYSDNVEMDTAYLKITGKTKEEYDKSLKQIAEEAKQQREEHQKQIPRLTKEWIQKGKEVLDEDKMDRWREIVPVRLNDLYQGMVLGNTLEVIKLLKEGKEEEAKETIWKQNHSGMSHSLLMVMIEEFYSEGKEFTKDIK